jgi:hypothetical protein
MPRDPRTLVKKAAIKPHLVETVCCRICFHLYSFEQQRLPPTFCQYKRFANSDPCSEELWVQKSTHSGIKDLGQFPRPSKKDYPAKFGVPRCLYVSQPILAWLELLLRKPDIEAAIDAWASKVLNSKAELMDVQHGTTFQKLSQVDTPSFLNLKLSLFVDWFNPRGNKTSGKIESTGVFALFCMNLPPTLRNKISNIGLAGITPGPYSPDTNTINHLLKPLVDELIMLDSGVIIKTYQHPEGRLVRV